MNNELVIKELESEFKITQGTINYDFTKLKSEAEQIAEYVSSIEVTEDTIKTNKQLVAKVSKTVKSIEDERIRVKKEMLKPYTEFEKEVKEIVSIVKEADNVVRDQIKEYEELERDNKRQEILSIWNKRTGHYKFKDSISFDDFITSQHLNKTMSIKKVEEEMIQYLLNIDTDLKTIQTLENSEEILEVYLEHLNLSIAIQTVQNRKEKQDQAQKLRDKMKSKNEVEETFVFKVTCKKDKKLVEMLLEENGVEYEVIK